MQYLSYFPFFVSCYLDVCFSMVCILAVRISLSHTHICLPEGYSFNFRTSIPVTFISESPQTATVLIKTGNLFREGKLTLRQI